MTASAKSYVLIIIGLAGETSYQQKFGDWAQQFIEAAKAQGLPEERIIYLSAESASTDSEAKLDREVIERTLSNLSQRLDKQDQLTIVLIGHANAQGKQTYFNIAGPDFSAEQLAEYLRSFTVDQLNIIATMSSSGGFIQALAESDRVLISATRSGAERYFPQFGAYFVRAFDPEDGADLDKDGQISMLEAFHYSQREVERFYQQEQRLQTEHAVLDDDGDGRPSSQPDAQSNNDGVLAARTFLVDSVEQAAGDTQLMALLETRELQALQVQKWLQQKPSNEATQDLDNYYAQLEVLMVSLARTDQAIRDRKSQAPVSSSKSATEP